MCRPACDENTISARTMGQAAISSEFSGGGIVYYNNATKTVKNTSETFH